MQFVMFYFFLDTDTVDYDNMDVIKDIQRRIAEKEKDLEVRNNDILCIFFCWRIES